MLCAQGCHSSVCSITSKLQDFTNISILQCLDVTISINHYSYWEPSCTNAPNCIEIPLSHSRTSIYPQGNLLCVSFIQVKYINSPVLSYLFLLKTNARHHIVTWFTLPPSLCPFLLYCFSSLLMAQVPINAESSVTPGFEAFLVVVQTVDTGDRRQTGRSNCVGVTPLSRSWAAARLGR